MLHFINGVQDIFFLEIQRKFFSMAFIFEDVKCYLSVLQK